MRAKRDECADESSDEATTETDMTINERRAWRIERSVRPAQQRQREQRRRRPAAKHPLVAAVSLILRHEVTGRRAQ